MGDPPRTAVDRRTGNDQVTRQVAAGLQITARVAAGQLLRWADATPAYPVDDHADQVSPPAWSPRGGTPGAGRILDPRVILVANLVRCTPGHDAPTRSVHRIDLVDLERDVGTVNAPQFCARSRAKQDVASVHCIVHRKHKGVGSNHDRETPNVLTFQQVPAFIDVDFLEVAWVELAITGCGHLSSMTFTRKVRVRTE